MKKTILRAISMLWLKTQMVQNLSMIADAFVNDAFACAHRNTPSVVGFTNTLPCIAGELMNYELTKLGQASKTQ